MESSKQFNRSPSSKGIVQKRSAGFILADNRPQSVLQKKANNTGLPGQLKNGIEQLSGHSLDDVKVHYNSDKPAQLNAHAYAQGSNIHLAAGQEKHLPHEAWHVVQQKQGRVKPTLQMKGKVNINDDAGLEKEADFMGSIAASGRFESTARTTATTSGTSATLQRTVINRFSEDALNTSWTEIEVFLNESPIYQWAKKNEIG